MTSLHKHLLTAGLLASLGWAAVAQTPPATAPAAPQAQQQRAAPDPARAQDRQARKQQRLQERLAMRLAYLKQKLQIAPAQEGAWTTWTAALQPQPVQRLDRAALRRMSTPERIDQMRAQRAARAAVQDRRGEATKAFYAGLSAEQRRVFDEISLRLLRAGDGGKRRGHHGHRG